MCHQVIMSDRVDVPRRPSDEEFLELAEQFETAARVLGLADRIAGQPDCAAQAKHAWACERSADAAAFPKMGKARVSRRTLCEGLVEQLRIVQTQAWLAAMVAATLTDLIDGSNLAVGRYEGPGMTLIALRAMNKQIPASLRSELNASATGAEALRRAERI
jgi:hypothetical protein